MLFQYISCWSLSSNIARTDYELSYFNTSHVEVYPAVTAIPIGCAKFQYISCWSLSSREVPYNLVFTISIHLMLKFIDYGFRNIEPFRIFNTSHVEVYLPDCRLFIANPSYFNTSHVEVYQRVISVYHFKTLYFNTSHVEVYQVLTKRKQAW